MVFHFRIIKVPLFSAEETQQSGYDIGVKAVSMLLRMSLQEVIEHLLAEVEVIVAQQANVDADDGSEAVGMLFQHVLPELLQRQPDIAHQARDAQGASVGELIVCVVVVVVLEQLRELGGCVLERLGAAGAHRTISGSARQTDEAQ